MKLKNDELIKFPDGSVLEYKKGTDKWQHIIKGK